MNTDFKTIKKVHFIGIGGIGVSAIARMMMLEGKEVSGSDQSSSVVTEELAKLGARIYYNHNASHLADDTDLVIYTIAVPPSNPEFAKAEELGIPSLTYPEALGQISRDKYTIAVSGTHGKTTTTAMIAKIFLEAGLDPTVVVGSFLKDYQSNFIAGTGNYFIAEACEYRRSFLNLHPKILVITNLEEDHLDYYKDLADIQTAFTELVERVPASGYIICNPNDKHLDPVLSKAKAKIIDYTKFDNTDLKLKFPGEHMMLDAKTALATASAVGIESFLATNALNNFNGTWRRFDFKGKSSTGADIYDDYAHHPDEVRATILAGKEKTSGKVIVVFQPHMYSRTRDFLPQFAEALALAHCVVIVPIYAAREQDDGSINSSMLVQEVKKLGTEAYFAPDFDEAIKCVKEASATNDLVLVMGAGDVTKVSVGLISD